MKHHIIYVTGLGDTRVGGQALLIRAYNLFGVESEIFQNRWSDGETFAKKQERLLRRVDELHQAGKTISLVAVSAGASAALNAYVMAPDKINAVIYVSGKLRGNVSPAYYKTNRAFYESMQILPESIARLTPPDKAKMRSIYSWLDPIVPAPHTRIPGVKGWFSPALGHVGSIAWEITFGAPRTVLFMKRMARS